MVDCEAIRNAFKISLACPRQIGSANCLRLTQVRVDCEWATFPNVQPVLVRKPDRPVVGKVRLVLLRCVADTVYGEWENGERFRRVVRDLCVVYISFFKSESDSTEMGGAEVLGSPQCIIVRRRYYRIIRRGRSDVLVVGVNTGLVD